MYMYIYIYVYIYICDNIGYNYIYIYIYIYMIIYDTVYDTCMYDNVYSLQVCLHGRNSNDRSDMPSPCYHPHTLSPGICV